MPRCMYIYCSTKLTKRDKIFMHYTNQFSEQYTCSTDWYDKTKINIQVQSECTMRKFRSTCTLHGINAHTKRGVLRKGFKVQHC